MNWFENFSTKKKIEPQHIYCTYQVVSWQLTTLLWGEIGHQHIKGPLTAAISSYFDLTHPPNPRMNMKGR